ncbi:MAG: DMT family transporter [Candidatus Dormibacteria bacterium]|nr:MAG: hypothetical protein DLM70_02445 [Chloroflexota bacterium]
MTRLNGAVERSERLAGVLAILTASGLWGASGGVVSGIAVNGVAAAAVVELVTGLTLLVVARATGASLRAGISVMSWSLLGLAVLEAGNASLYYLALHMAPLGVVIALHLTSPLMLALVELIRGSRTPTLRDLVSVISVAAAIIVIGTAEGGGNGPNILLGLFLSLTSAACLAVFITMVRRLSSQTSSAMGSGLQTMCSGLLLAPGLLLLDGHAAALPPLALTALVLFAPASWFYWRSLRSLESIPAATIQLSEPIFGAGAALILFGTVPSLWDAVAVALILVAAWLELTRPIDHENDLAFAEELPILPT